MAHCLGPGGGEPTIPGFVLYDAFAPKVAIAEPPGRGVLLGIELEDRETRKPANEMCREAVRQCEAKGLLVQARGSHPRTNVMRLVPPMVGTDNEIEQGLAILEEVFAGVARGRVGARDIAAE